jgi:ketosteroid isomerase-like protein
MSQEIIEAFRREYAAMSRKDWDTVFSVAVPDFELKTPAGGLDDGVVRGAASARRAFEEFFTPYETLTVEPEAFFEGDGQIVVFFVQRARPRESSAFLERRAAHLWTMRGNKAIRLEIFPRRGDALEAAGLSE